MFKNRLFVYLEYIDNNNYDINKSSIHGKGIFSKFDIDKNDFINMHFLRGLDDNLNITRFGRYLNHSYTPNAISRKCDDGYRVFALKDIKKGDEITLNYTVNKNFEQPPF